MSLEIKVPPVGESITEGVLTNWLVNDGDFVELGDEIFELETDKITMMVPAEKSGVVKISVPAETKVEIGQVVGSLDTEATPTIGSAETTPQAIITPPAGLPQMKEKLSQVNLDELPPAARKLATESNVDLNNVSGTGKRGQITKSDILKAVANPKEQVLEPKMVIPPIPPMPNVVKPEVVNAPKPINVSKSISSERVTRKPMTPLRARIAERLIQSQQNAAILTTFNEVDMSAVIELRNRLQDDFVKKHGVKLGFMSFFVKAAIDALKTVPEVNGWIEGDSIFQNHFYDIGVAVSTDKGLVVPVIRDADMLPFADVEKVIADFGVRAKNKQLTLDDLTGGVFTVSNGGIFGSMLSTPILNPPQSAILGLHAIKKRPVVIDDKIEIRPMMYLALSYDHRMVDGREAVTFLKRIVDCIEAPERMLLGV